ncbi:CPK4 [Symbiodinium sp. CCMP2456]|nr:CPK4 [Symbiodinium sp. CCMP2456]
MIEVCCHSADLSVPIETAVLSAEVELDGFVIGRTQPCSAPGPRSQPSWEERFPVMGTGRWMTLRVLDPNMIGESRFDLQAFISQQRDGQKQASSLLRGEALVGTIWASVQPLSSPSRAKTAGEAPTLSQQLQILRQGSSSSQSPGSKMSNGSQLRSPGRRLGCIAFPSRAGQRSPIPCGGSAPRVSSPSPVMRSNTLLEERRPAPLGAAVLTAAGTPQASASGTPGTSRFKANSDLDSARHSQISGASPASASTARASPNAPRPARSRSTLSAGSEKSPGSRLNFTEKAQRDLVELMRSKDRLRAYAERPFKAGRALLAGNRLGFEDFQQALRELLQELHISVPGDKQMQALFDKHRGENEGVSSEDFEALLFRLLCFLRASEEVRVNPGADARSCSEERDKRWRQEFIQKNPQRFHDVYEVQRQLGKGSFGTVYLVSHRTQVDQNKEKRVRVCKIISKLKAKEAKTSEAKVREEFAVLKQLDHPHVLRIFEDFEDDENFYLVMEQCRGGDLGAYVKRLEPMDAYSYEFWVSKVMQHTLSAIAYCHSKAVIHKDLKPENVMLSTTRDTPVAQMHVVVVDFGLAEVFANSTDRSDVVSGTPPYMAPEVWQGNFSKSCDVWSAGCMLFFLLSGRLPFIAATVKEFPKAVQQEPDWAPALAHSSRRSLLCELVILLDLGRDGRSHPGSAADLQADAPEDGASAADCTDLFEGVQDWESSPSSGRVQLCIRGVHTFLRFTDEGCFQHLTWRGRYRSEEDAANFEKKACPLAASGNRNRLSRQILQWYRAHALGCFGSRILLHQDCPSFQSSGAPAGAGKLRAALWRSQQALHSNTWAHDDVPPFSMSDVAQACLLGSPERFDWRREKLLDWVRLGSCGQVAGSVALSESPSNCACSGWWSVWCRGPEQVYFAQGSMPFSNSTFANKTCWCDGGRREEPNWPSWLEASQLCTTFLQLPLLWDGVGFDKDGIMWENNNIRNVRTFYGRVVYVGSKRRAAAHHCERSTLRETGDIGGARHARLVLRALLPTYYRHVYARNVANIFYHGIATTSLDDVFATEVSEVCRTSSGWLDHMWTHQSLRKGYLLSHDAMSRDMDSCDTSWPCHYDRVDSTDSTDEGCLLCDAQRPCFHGRVEEACTSPDFHFSRWHAVRDSFGSARIVAAANGCRRAPAAGGSALAAARCQAVGTSPQTSKRQCAGSQDGAADAKRSCLRCEWFVQMGLAGHSNPAGALNNNQIQSLLAVGQRSEFEKFVTRFVATQLDASQQTTVNEAFKAFDADGDGHLSAEELRQGLMQFGASPEQAEQIVSELDVGRTGQVSYTEFLAGIINLRCKKPEEQDRLLSIAWEQFRPDTSGLVKVQDIQNALATRGMTVADMPDGFLAALNKDHTQYISFDSFKSLLLFDDSDQLAAALTAAKAPAASAFFVQPATIRDLKPS